MSTPNRLTFIDPYDPRGPDGQGRNRLAIHTWSPRDRCLLRPLTRQAAIDTARGMASFGVITSYGLCIGTSCKACRINNVSREAWRETWVIWEDEQRGGIWLMGSLKPDAFGYHYKSWESLMRAIELPMLERVIDPHWGTVYRGATQY